MHRQAGRSILHFSVDVTSEEVCFVDIAVVSCCLEELFVKLVSPCFVKISCSSFHSVDFLVIRWCIWRSSVFAARLDHVQICEFVSDSTSIQTLLRVSKWAILSDLAFVFLDVFAMRVDANNHTLGRDNEFLLCSWSTEDDVLFQTDFFLSFWHIVVLLNRLFSWLGFLTDSFCFSLSLPCHAQMNIARAFWHPRSTICALFFSRFLKNMLLLCLLIVFFFEKSIWFAVAVRECNYSQSLIIGSFSAPFFRHVLLI